MLISTNLQIYVWTFWLCCDHLAICDACQRYVHAHQNIFTKKSRFLALVAFLSGLCYIGVRIASWVVTCERLL